MIAGFGNLSGEMDFWDLKNMKIVGTAKSPSAINYIWSPDGR
jgi:translation initiation factor 2A